jgi:hypothetical protein
MTDMWDPNTWRPVPHEFRIWLDDQEHRYAVLDEEDYLWAVQWRWSAKLDKHGRKFYAFRNLTERRGGIKNQTSLYLHVAILKRTGLLPPTPTPKNRLATSRSPNTARRSCKF